MSPRTGRPKSTNPKCIDIKVRVDEETNEKLAALCVRTGENKAAVIRRAILELLSRQK